MHPSPLRLARACAAGLSGLACCAGLALAPAGAQPSAAATTAATPDAPIPAASFFDHPAFSGAALAPNAAALAVRFGGDGARDRLAVIDLRTNALTVVAQFKDADIGDFQWVNDERLVYALRDNRQGAGALRRAPGLFAVDRDGARQRQLASLDAGLVQERRGARPLLPWNTFLLRQRGRQDDDTVYVTQPQFASTGELDHVDLLRLDTVTGRASVVARPAAVRGWLLDHEGAPRLAIAYDDNVATLWYRDPAKDAANGAWRALAAFDAYRGGAQAFEPLAFGPDGALYVRAAAGADKLALRRFDLAANALRGDALLAVGDYDFSGELVTDASRVLGVRHLTDTERTVWFDAHMQAIQAAVDARLPATVNLVTPAPRAATPWLLVESFSDTQPLRYALYNSASGALNPVGDAHPAIDARRMATQQLVHYKARDGLSIPAWLTLPHGGARNKLPLVVLVHGGPGVRGTEWGWRADSQFLAARGYAVLEPEFRGSAGFGAAHFEAGWKQWGLAMQDDLADGARWAVGEGIVDARRICIAGASYGGYATLMGLVNDPDLYRCGIDWAGVTDIKLLYTGAWNAKSDLSDAFKRFGMPLLVGDPVKDAAQLKATSPIEQAARIKAPLLLAYGGADLRVPLYHGRRFYDAVKRTNPDVDWVVYGDEGHGWALAQNRIDFWDRVAAFLERHIGH